MFAEFSRQGVDNKGQALDTSVVRFRLLPVVRYRRLGRHALRTARVNLRFSAAIHSLGYSRLFYGRYFLSLYN